eukprot:gene34987-45285_t
MVITDYSVVWEWAPATIPVTETGLRGRPISGDTDFNTRPALDFLAHLHKANTTLVIIGDSTSRKKLQALECELIIEEKIVKIGYFLKQYADLREQQPNFKLARMYNKGLLNFRC